jgi:type IV secretory pathway TrbF-like protein
MTLSKAGLTKHEETIPYWLAAQEEWNEKIGAERADALRDELISITQV